MSGFSSVVVLRTGGCGGGFCAGRSCVMIRFDLMMGINWMERMCVSMRRS